MHSTGFREDQGQFSRDIVGTIIEEYADIALRLSNRRWNNIKELCGAHHVVQQANLNTCSAQLNRHALYESSSPVKGAGKE